MPAVVVRPTPCDSCLNRPAGCWKAEVYGCERERHAAKMYAIRNQECPLGKFKKHSMCLIPMPELQPGECPVCSIADPIPDPELPLEYRTREWAIHPDVRQRHITAFHEMLRRDFQPPAEQDKDGIVYCGEGRYWPGIVIGVRLLRESGCELPIQVWHNAPVGNQLDDYDVRLVDASQYAKNHPARKRDSFAVKSYALAHCGFSRVLFLDADAYCVADPTSLFGLLDKSPFVFWNNVPRFNKHLQWHTVGVSPGGIPAVQGGHYLLDLHSFWNGLMTLRWWDNHADYFYTNNHSCDEDGWRAIMTAKGITPTILKSRFDRVGFVCQHQEQDVIVHRTNSKLYPHRNRRYYRFPMESRVWEIFGEVVGSHNCVRVPSVPGQDVTKPRHEQVQQIRERRHSLVG